MNERTPAEVFPPGDFLREEIEARGWSQSEFAEIIGRPIKTVNEIIAGKRRITPVTAKELEAALGISARSWMNHETIYQLHNAHPPSERIRKEANIRSLFPVRDLVNRGWLEASGNPDVIEAQLLDFFEIKSLEEQPQLCHAARRSESSERLSPHQLAWLFRVKKLARACKTTKYSERALSQAVEQLKTLMTAPEDTARISNILANAGVRFVIVEPFLGARIDGVCLWLDKNSPAIGMTLRFDRIDNFWFVLRHEIEHILQRHGEDQPIIDSELEKSPADGKSPEKQLEEERIANMASAEFCMPQSVLNDFLARAGHLPSRKHVMKFAMTQRVHPGIAVGQIQRKLGRYDLFRNQLARIREYVTSTALTDGYGQVAPRFSLP